MESEWLTGSSSAGDGLFSEQEDPWRRPAVRVCEIAGKGKGLFATRSFASQEIVMRGIPRARLRKPTRYSLQVAASEHVDFDEPACLINHSCYPTTAVRLNHFGGYDFIALQPLAVHDEVTYDYETTEEWLSFPIEPCLCGSAMCRKRVTGFHALGPQLQHFYRDAGYLSPHLAQILQHH